jgi:hypothetical protein
MAVNRFDICTDSLEWPASHACGIDERIARPRGKAAKFGKFDPLSVESSQHAAAAFGA